MADEPGQVRVKCKHCDTAQVIDDKRLATEVQCSGCNQNFEADWGEPVLELPAPEPSEEVTRDT